MLSDQEKMFLNRVAIKVATGSTMEVAFASVLADDRRIAATVERLGRYEREGLTRKIAHGVFARIHGAAALA